MTGTRLIIIENLQQSVIPKIFFFFHFSKKEENYPQSL